MFNVSIREYFLVLNVFIVCIRNTAMFKSIPLLCTHVYSYMFSTLHPREYYLTQVRRWVQAWNLKGDDDLLSLLDPKLKEYDEDELWRMTHVAFLCTQAAAVTRPSMARVVTMVLGDMEIPGTVSGPGFMSGLMGTPPSKATTEVSKSISKAGFSSSSTSNSRKGRSSEDESPFLSSTTTSQMDTTDEILNGYLHHGP